MGIPDKESLLWPLFIGMFILAGTAMQETN